MTWKALSVPSTSLGAQVLPPSPLCVLEWVTQGLGMQDGDVGSTGAYLLAPGTPRILPWGLSDSSPFHLSWPTHLSSLRWQQLHLYKRVQRQCQQKNGHRTWTAFYGKYANLQEK